MTQSRTNPGPDDPTHTVTERIAEAITEVTYDQHPTQHMEKVRQMVVDALGNALLARDTPLGRGYIESSTLARNGTEIVGGGRASPVDAVFANAGLMNALDWDDTVEGGGHPGSSIIPTALFVGEREDATVPEFLNAVLLGYEVSVRVVIALQPTWERYDIVHGSGTRHAIGAAAAAAALADHDVETTQELLGFAAQLAPVPHAAKFGWSEQQLTWLKDNNARAATAAARATTLVDRFTGPREVLDGEGGFWRMAGSDQCDWEVLGRPLCDPYMFGRVSIKPYPCCRWLHTAVEAASRAAVDIDEVESVRVETAERVAKNFMLDPTNQVNAEFSLPFAVGQATAGLDTFNWYTEDGPAPSPSFEVTAVEGSKHTQRFADERVVSATVTVTSTDGTSVSETVDQPLGTSDRPLKMARSREKLVAGFDRQAADGTTRADEVVETLSGDGSISALLDKVRVE